MWLASKTWCVSHKKELIDEKSNGKITHKYTNQLIKITNKLIKDNAKKGCDMAILTDEVVHYYFNNYEFISMEMFKKYYSSRGYQVCFDNRGTIIKWGDRR